MLLHAASLGTQNACLGGGMQLQVSQGKLGVAFLCFIRLLKPGEARHQKTRPHQSMASIRFGVWGWPKSAGLNTHGFQYLWKFQEWNHQR